MLFLLIPILLILISTTLFYNLDPDFGWHILVGQKMLDTKNIISSLVGYQNFQNIKLADHEWLSEISMTYLYNHFGYLSLIVLSFLACFATFGLLLLINKKFKLTREISIFVTLIAIMPYVIIYGVRLQLMIPLSALILFAIAKFQQNYFKRLFFYFIIFSLGINLHGGFVMLSIIPLILEFHLFCKKEEWKDSFLKTLGTGIIILVAMLINPYGLNYWKLILDYLSDGFYKSHIKEWLPIYFPNISLGALIHLSLTIFIFLVNKYWKKIQKNDLLLLMILLYLGIQYRRFYPLFAIISTPYLGLALSDLFQKVRAETTRKILVVISFVSFFLIFLLYFRLDNYKKIHLNPIRMDRSYPVQSALYLKSYIGKGNLFNCYDWGGYLLLANPKIKVYIDGRGPQTKISNDKTIFQDYYDFYSSDPKVIEKQLNNYSINWVLIPRSKEIKRDSIDKFIIRNIQGRKNEKPLSLNLMNYLNSRPEWQKVFEDSVSVVYKKK